MIRTVLHYPNKALSESADPVEVGEDGLSEDTLKLIEDMRDTCVAYRADGLAATQLGVSQQIFVTNIGGDFQVFVNPTLSFVDEVETVKQAEGCLSFPGVYATIERPSEVEVTCLDETGESRTFVMDEQEAVAVQHEYDHLIGKTFLDRVGKIQRRQIKKKLAKTLKQFQRATKKKVKPSPRAAARVERKRQRKHRRSAA